MLTGLRLNHIKSDGFKGQFNRYYLSEHELIYTQNNRELFWFPGKIIYHLRTWAEARIYYNELIFNYDEGDLYIDNVTALPPKYAKIKQVKPLLKP